MTVIGSVIMWAADAIPDDALVLDGSLIEISLYQDLYNVLQDIYTGDNDPEGYFRLPDMRGRVLRGVSMGSGNDPDADTRDYRGDGQSGDKVGTRQGDAFKRHRHLTLAGAGSSNSTAITAADSITIVGGDERSTNTNTGSISETRCDNIALTFITFFQ